MKTVTILCPRCGTVKTIDQTKLAAHYNKSVKIACGNTACAELISVKVDAELFNQKPLNPEERKFKTELIDDNRPQTTKLPQLEVLANEWTQSQLLKLSEGENIIGRNEGNALPNKLEVQTEDKRMSRKHFKITVEKNGSAYVFALKDLGSTNGTKLNDKSIGQSEIYFQVNDAITAGKTLFQLV